MEEQFVIIHNPKCSKSRAALEILESKNISPKVVDYLNGDLDKKFLVKTFKALNKRPKEVLRTKEEDFKQLELDLDKDEQVIEAILKYPKILERPIVIKGEKAVIGRPPENVFNLIE